ncbi:MAG TPA: cupredoxin domain-containing protein [Pyrinomonadaceae bacterium]|nr:cupredoxin domain-containing protein [Pyrinomonadaceae bacterium]
MNTTQLIVTLVGFGIIGWIVWYFWLWKGESVTAQAAAGCFQIVAVTVRGGYQPQAIVAKAGQPLRLNFTRRESTPCGEEVVLPEFGKRAHLPENRTVAIEIVPPKPGEYEFTCGMNMYKGKLIVE